jgi:HEAT repeat protein
VALLADPRGDDVSTSALAAWAESASVLAPLAARALPSRDSAVVRGHLKRLLAATDTSVRAHAALGLADDPEPDSASLLVSAYQYEEEPSVRRAIVRALSGRSEVQRQRTLELARDLDPDEGVRALARSALAGRELLRFERSAGERWTSVAWVTLAPTDHQARRVRYRAARLTRPDGLTVPVVADPDGVLIVAGLPVGHIALDLAPDREPGDARAP